MQINPCNFIVREEQSTTLTQVDVTSVSYNNNTKVCNVYINGKYNIIFSGTAYDALGQWTDSSLLTAVISKIGATVSGSQG